MDLDRKSPRLHDQDLVIATYWTTVCAAEALELGPVVHFCQGYEGDYPHLADRVSEIEETYHRRLPTFVVSPHLGAMLERRFNRRWKVTSPPLDPVFKPLPRERPRPRPWIAVHGIFECDWKGVPTGLQTVRLLREQGLSCRLMRFSLLPLSVAERALVAPNRFLCRVSPRVAAKKLRQCDLLLFPSLEAEGFGLPLLEAMASGVPAVASDISATRFVTDGAVVLLPPGDGAAFADAARDVLSDPVRWRETRDRGLAAAEKFTDSSVTKMLQDATQWAVSPVCRESQ